MLALNEVKQDLIIEFDNQIFQVVSREFIKNARGKPILATKLKNLITNKIAHHTFQQSDAIKEAEIEKNNAQFLYRDGDNYHFMDNSSYEQFSLPKDMVGSKVKFLRDDIEVVIQKHNEDIIGITLPVKMDFKVVSAPPSLKGNSAQSNDKEVEIETGYKIKTPLFIEEGSIIRVNTEKGIYVERISN